MSEILIVEDDHQISSLLQIYLNGMEIGVEIEHNPANAVELLKSRTFKIVITDINMEPINGLDLIDKVRGSAPTTKFVLMSGSFTEVNDSFDHLKEEYHKHGVAAFLPKPFLMSDIFKVLAECNYH